MKYYIIAGEASGDLHASNLIKALKDSDNTAQFRGWGGDMMTAAGAIVVKHYRDLAFMGFVEVLLNIRTILNNLSFCKKDIAKYNPDAVILIDYPGFNLQIAKHLKKKGVRVFYYISPQVWAWKKSRVHTIRKVVEKMIVILPFEKDFYMRYGIDATYAGHPLLDVLPSKSTAGNYAPSTNGTIALLPGSRRQEIKRVLPVMIKLQQEFPERRFVIAALSSVGKEFYNEIAGNSKVEMVFDQTYSLLQSSDAALVTSGTATLETAIIGVPQIVCYKAANISYQIARRIIKVKYISLVNLIMNKQVVKELIQNDMSVPNLRHELDLILNNDQYRQQITGNYNELRKVLGGSGASQRAALTISNALKK